MDDKAPISKAIISKAIYVEYLYEGKKIRKELIPAFTELPDNRDFVFYYSVDTKLIRLPLYQGKRKIQEIKVPVESSLPKGTRIEMNLNIDEHSFITVKGMIGEIPFDAALETPTPRSMPSQEEIQKLDKAFKESVTYLQAGKKGMAEARYKIAKKSFDAAYSRGDTDQAVHDFEEMEEIVTEVASVASVELSSQNDIFIRYKRRVVENNHIDSKKDKPNNAQDKQNIRDHNNYDIKKQFPFLILRLPTHEQNDKIVARGEELCRTIKDGKQKSCYRWAVEELTNKPYKRFMYELEEYARRLELDVATLRLLEHLIPGMDYTVVHTGRYTFLGTIVQQRPRFLQGLLNEDKKSVTHEWSVVLKEQESNVQFLHGLAVLYREQALASSGDSSEGESWLIGTALWSLLISTEAFWDYFSRDRVTNRDTGDRDALTPEDQESLMESILRGILSSHGSLGNQLFVAGQFEKAQGHFHCLDLCRQGEEALIESLREHSLTCKLNPAEKLLSKVRTFADETLDDVCNGIVREAKKISSDPEIIRRLDEGIRKNYEGGIRYIDNFIKLDIPVIRVLRQSLEWYNQWCYDLYVTQQLDRVKQLMKPAIVIAEQLIPLCTKGQAYRPENHALSQHYLFRGFTTDEPQNAVSEYEEALEWNISNDNAKQLLGDAYKSIVMKQLDRAVERAKSNDFSGAFEILDAVEEQIEDSDSSGQEQVRSARGYICFQYANILADDGKFREALKYAKQAHEIIPDQKVIEKLVDEMEEYAPEEDNLRSLKSARELLDKDHYDQAIRCAAEVSTGSRFYGSACRVQSSAFFHRGINAANKERFDDAVKDLEHALKLNDDNEDRKVISKQLEILRQNRIGLEVKKAFESNNWTRAEQILRNELKKNLSQNFKTDLQKYLSMVLNAKAVDLINETQKMEKKFADAINDIMKTVKEQPGVQ